MNLGLQLHFDVEVQVKTQAQLFVFSSVLTTLALAAAEDTANGLTGRVGHSVDSVAGRVLDQVADLVHLAQTSEGTAVLLLLLGLAALAALATRLLGSVIHCSGVLTSSLGTRSSLATFRGTFPLRSRLVVRVGLLLEGLLVAVIVTLFLLGLRGRTVVLSFFLFGLRGGRAVVLSFFLGLGGAGTVVLFLLLLLLRVGVLVLLSRGLGVVFLIRHVGKKRREREREETRGRRKEGVISSVGGGLVT